MKWSFTDIPDQIGKVCIVTGANSGIGEPTARELGRAGAQVILACRNPEKAEKALERLRVAAPEATFEFMQCDLADLESVKTFAAAFKERFKRLDILVNNAGVMIPPYSKTKQGFELQFGTNHLGHFALTGLLLDLITATPGSRIVTVASMAHKMGKVRFDDLNREKKYRRWEAYGQSKVANLFFTYELQRRLANGGHGTLATAAHPGWTRTNLQQYSVSARIFGPVVAMGPDGGAKPTLRAATDPGAASGDYFGPKHMFQMRGAPVKVGSSTYSKREDVATQLWSVSEDLTGVSFLSKA